MNSIKICRICFEISNKYEIFDVKHKYLLKTINIKLRELDAVVSILCDRCMQKINKYHNFKTTAYINEFFLKSNVKSSDLSDTSKLLKQDDVATCAFCLQTFSDRLWFSNSLYVKELLKKPPYENDFLESKETICCEKCMDTLHELKDFATACFESDKLIESYISATGKNNFEMCELLQFNPNNLSDSSHDTHVLIIDEEIKTEEIDIKEEPLQKEDFVFNDKEDEPVSMKKQIYNCYHCSYNTTTKSNLILHLLVHNDNAPKIKCAFCHFTTKWKSSMHSHKQLHMRNIKTYDCKLCEYTTRFPKHLKRHGMIHIKKLNNCMLCPYKTYSLLMFKAHNLKIHHTKINLTPAEKVPSPKVVTNHKCQFCSYNTTRMCHLKDHILKHKNNDEVKLFMCKYCTFQTKYKKSLSHHEHTKHLLNKNKENKN